MLFLPIALSAVSIVDSAISNSRFILRSSSGLLKSISIFIVKAIYQNTNGTQQENTTKTQHNKTTHQDGLMRRLAFRKLAQQTKRCDRDFKLRHYRRRACIFVETTT